MTAQVPDRIRLDDGTLRVLHGAPDIFGPDARRRAQFAPRPTANYRGYTARWRVADGRLWLESLGGTVLDRGHGPMGGTQVCTLADIHGTSEPVFASWITTDLLMPEPERPWTFTFGTYLRLPVAAGRLSGPLERVEIKGLSWDAFRSRVRPV